MTTDTRADQIDINRGAVWALLYMMAEVHEGVVRIFPDVHGLYETWEAGNAARNTKERPGDYQLCRAHWRKP